MLERLLYVGWEMIKIILHKHSLSIDTSIDLYLFEHPKLLTSQVETPFSICFKIKLFFLINFL